jgi:hypothetical protein
VDFDASLENDTIREQFRGPDFGRRRAPGERREQEK